MARVTLIETFPWDAVTGLPVPVRMAGGGRRHYRHQGHADWLAGVVRPPEADAELRFDGSFTGGGIAEAGAIGFMPARDAARAQIAALLWTGAPITVWTGDDATDVPDWTIELAGKVAGYAVQSGMVTFTIANLAGKLLDPVVSATFAGSGGVEGTAQAAGRLKRRSFGRVWNVECRLLDGGANIYECGDPAFPLQSIDAVKDKGRSGPLTVVAWAGSVAATLAALKAAAAPQGGAAVAPSIACIKWWTQPSLLTADLRGEIGAGYVETVAGIAAALSAAAGGPPIEALAAAIAARPDPAGLHLDSESENGVAALDRLLLGASMAWGVTTGGAISLSPLAFADPVATLTAVAPIERVSTYAPAKSISVGWRKNHRRHNAGEISAAGAGGSVTWEDIGDPNGTKPADGADVTGDNTSKDTAAVGGKPAGEVLGALDSMIARQHTVETVTIPAIEAAGAAAGQRITEARAAADLALATIEDEVDRVDQRIDNLSASGGYDDTAVNTRITDERELSLDRDAALGTRIDTVTASIATTDTNLRALVSTKEQAAVDREHAISQRIDKIIAEGGGGSEGVDTVARSEINRVEQAAVLGQTALSGRATVLEASVATASGVLNGNPSFAIWPSGQTLPYKWGFWANLLPIERRARADGSAGNVARLSISAGAEGGLLDNFAMPPGWYVIEADVQLVSGSYSGAGLTIAGEVSLHFATEADLSGTISATTLVRRRFSKIVQLGGARENWHLMVNWSAWPLSEKVIDWYRCAIRPASDAEIKAGKADTTLIPALSARIKTTEDTLADLPNRYATAQRATNIEASVGTAVGRIGSLERVTSDGTLATGNRVDNVEASLNNSRATVSQQAGAIAGIDGRTAVYWQVTGTTSDGQTTVRLSKANGQPGLFYVNADMLLNGNLVATGTITSKELDYGASGEASILYRADRVTFSSSSGWTTMASLSITSRQGQPVRGEFTCILLDLSGTNTSAQVRVVRVADGTPIWGGAGGAKIAARDEGETFVCKWFDSVNAGVTVGFEVQMRKNGGTHVIAADYRCGELREMTRDRIQGIDISTPSGEGPGRGSSGGGNINGGGYGLGSYNLQ